MTEPLIMVAPTGARRTKRDHPQLPVKLPELIETARSCHMAGAGAMHVHLRDDRGAHTLDVGRYREALQELNLTVPGMKFQITTEAAGHFSVDEQLACLAELSPDWASISVREIARAPDCAPRVYATCRAQGTEVQHILYDVADAALLMDWISKGIVPDGPISVLIVLGRYDRPLAGRVGDPGPVLEILPAATRWMVCAFGPTEHQCLTGAARLGGDCRVGFENSLCNGDGRRWRDNAHSVQSLVSALGRMAA